MISVIQVLSIMDTATKALSDGANPTASLILPLKDSIIKQLDNFHANVEDVTPCVHDAAMAIKHDLETR